MRSASTDFCIFQELKEILGYAFPEASKTRFWRKATVLSSKVLTPVTLALTIAFVPSITGRKWLKLSNDILLPATCARRINQGAMVDRVTYSPFQSQNSPLKWSHSISSWTYQI